MAKTGTKAYLFQRHGKSLVPKAWQEFSPTWLRQGVLHQLIRWFMVVERRAAAAKLATARQAACQSAHRHNMAAAREEMATAGWRPQEQEDSMGAEAAMAPSSLG
jgi:hypothetical protein